MALQPTLSQRPLPDNSLATTPAWSGELYHGHASIMDLTEDELYEEMRLESWRNFANAYDEDCGMEDAWTWALDFSHIVLEDAFGPGLPWAAPPAILPQALQPSTDVFFHADEVERKIVATKRAKGTTRADELIEDIEHALDDKGRWNKWGVAMLIDNYYLRKGARHTHVENPAVTVGAIVEIEIDDNERAVVLSRGEIEEMMTRVHNVPKEAKLPRPFVLEPTSPIGDTPIGISAA